VSQLDRLLEQLVAERSLQRIRLEELADASDLEPDLVAVLQSRCQEALDEIDDALRSLLRGTYGRCSGCEAAIPFERLEAVPSARHCVRCQSGLERAYR
jgi:DnaK suppressor protein